MGSKLRHFGALMKKNWIIWKRTLGASLCELFCPVALMAILAIVRVLVTSDTIAAQSNVANSKLFTPVDYLSETNITLSLIQGQQRYGKYLTDMGNLTIDRVNPIMNFLTAGCRKIPRSDERPVIAFAAKDNYAKAIQTSIMKIQQNQIIYTKTVIAPQVQALTKQYDNEVNQDKKNQIMANITLLKRINATIMTNLVNFTYMTFETHDDIIKYISAGDYMMNNGKKGVCFGFSVLENNSTDIDIKLIFNDHEQEPDARQLPSQILGAWSKYKIDQDKEAFNLYTQQGYSFLQNWLVNEVLRNKTGKATAEIAMMFVPYKADAYISDDFGQVLSSMMSFFMLLMYILPVYRLISNIVSEKESKARESMRMMGLSDASYWLSWFTYYLIIVTIISVLCIIILSANVFKFSNRGYIFLYFWVYGMSLFSLCIFLQAFFSTARVAAITGTLIYFGTSFITQAVADQSVSTGSKNLASLLTTVAVSLGTQSIGLFETNGMGINSETIKSYYNNYAFQDCLVMMAISFFLFLWVGIYLDNVLPSAFGLRKPFYFCCTRGYWFGNRPRRDRIQNRLSSGHVEDSENLSLFEQKYMKKENFEPASRELAAQENDDKILKISELQKKFSNGFHAVKGLNIKMYNGQIFALLGHNGAGKTTTISMLTGLIESTAGSAEVFGYDLFNDMSSVRNFLGVCPQHDILFDLLTPEEHLDIFCDFKGVPRKDKKEEIKKMLIDVDVYGNKDTEAKNLSGGNRRKLSVAIALIGGSKLVLLDEPTAGMDLSARRKLWNMLKNYKHNRIIILTTHYMDEADILGDRIGIMTGGQLICLGSSLFLKNRFGVGYNLTMVKKSKESNTKVGKYLENKIGEVKKLSEVSSEITYQIPTALSNKFKDFFPQFDQELESLDIRSYGISVTTLEEVFLKVGHGDDSDDALKIKEELKKQATEHHDKSDEYSVADDHETGAMNIFGIHLDAMIRKRIQLYKRNYKGLVVEVLIPVILVLIGFGFSKVQFFIDGPVRPLVPSQLPLKQRIQYNSEFFVTTAGQTLTPKTFIDSLPDSSNAFAATARSYASRTNRSEVIFAFDNDTFEARLEKPYEPFRFGSYFLYEVDNVNKQYKINTFLNLTSQDGTALYPEFMYESVLKVATGNSNFKLKMSTHPFPITENLRQRAKSASGFFIVFVVAIGFSMIPASVVTFIVNEREKSLKHMQLVSGMSLAAYWVSNIVFDIVKSIIPSAIVIGLIYAFELGYDYVWILFLIYPIGVIPFSYVSSFLFTNENLCQTLTIFIHFIIGGIGGIIAGILRIIESTYSAGDILVWVFKVIPTFCLTDSILYQSLKARLIQIRPELNKPDLDINAIGGDILIMLIHGIFWTFVLLLIELGAFNCFGRCFGKLIGRKVHPRENLNQDEDVIEEEKRVESLGPEQLKVRVNKFRKVYSSLNRKPYCAVEKASFGLDYGECFALLGVNGAGKTTTFKSLTGGIAPSSGEVTICGMDIQNDFNKVRKLIGYCPQYDAIFPLMSVEEHLYFYARIKGIRKDLRTTLVEKQIKEMSLEEHRTKAAGTLSGGNKRKLSVAMCVIGNPPIILLDEPSAGMDPEARRFMWSVVAKISQQRKKSAVILTTHSMEEAEALSTKMGIMVQGGIFKCFGSSQHIKSKYGTGYEIEVKVRKQSNDELKIMIERFGLSGQDSIHFNELEGIMRKMMVHDFLIGELRQNGLGNDLCLEADEHSGQIEVKNFVSWIYIEQAGMKIIEGLCDDFDQVDILEHYNDYYKLRVPRKDKSIGYVFSLIESKKEQFHISEYSASQTTLEQIFQTFANLKIDGDNVLKFHKKNGAFQRAATLKGLDKAEHLQINEVSDDYKNSHKRK